MIVTWGNHFGKRTVWSLIYFLNYSLLSYLAQSQILVISLYIPRNCCFSVITLCSPPQKSLCLLNSNKSSTVLGKHALECLKVQIPTDINDMSPGIRGRLKNTIPSHLLMIKVLWWNANETHYIPTFTRCLKTFFCTKVATKAFKMDTR